MRVSSWILGCLAVLSSVASGTQAISTAPYQLIAVPRAVLPDPRLPFARVSRGLGLDAESITEYPDRVELVASDAQRAALRAAGLDFEVRIADLEAFYAGRLDPRSGVSSSLGAWLQPAFGQGSMGGYYTFREVESVLDQIHQRYPTLTLPPQVFGRSIEGRPLIALKVSDQPQLDEAEPECRFDALHHAREPASLQCTLWFLLWLLETHGSDPLSTYLVNERELWFVPVVNPDGYAYNELTHPGGGGLWRKNRRDHGGGVLGVDLNRNYPLQWGLDDSGSSPLPGADDYRGAGPASEPEVAAMVSLLAARDFRTALSTHSYSDLWLYPWGYTFQSVANDAEYHEIAALATEINGYRFGPAARTLYPTNGSTIDQDHGVYGTLSFTPEIGSNTDGFWPPSPRIVPLAEENLSGFQRTALAAGAYVHLTDWQLIDQGDGDGAFESGEDLALQVTVRNSGRQTSATPVEVEWIPSGPALLVPGGPASIAPPGPFQDGGSPTPSLRAKLASPLPDGMRIPFVIRLRYEGYEQDIEGSLIVGRPRPYLIDDLEVDVGWTAGVPSDTATTGIWEYGDPVGTITGAFEANPEDDASVSGSRCFTTGNGSATDPQRDDVDDGVTTLISPAIDVSTTSRVEIQISHWFADFFTLDDQLLLDVTADDGVTWTPVLGVQGLQNRWQSSRFLLADHVVSSASVRLRFRVADAPDNSIVEAAVDELRVFVYGGPTHLHLFGTPRPSGPLYSCVSGAAGDLFVVMASPGIAQRTVPGFGGTLLLDPAAWYPVYHGTIPPAELHQITMVLPADPTLVGTTTYLQAVVLRGARPFFSNRARVDVER